MKSSRLKYLVLDLVADSEIEINVQLSDGSLKSKLRRANKDKSSYVIIVGDEELQTETVILKSLSDKEFEQKTLDLKELKQFITNLE